MVPPVLSQRPSRIPLAALLLAACGAERPTAAPAAVLRELPAGVLQAVVQRWAGAEAGTVRYTVRVVERTRAAAAWQGTLTVAPGAWEVVGVETPTGAGATYVVNAEEAGAGRVRFAAFGAEALGGDEAFTVTVRERGPAGVGVTLEAAGQADGRAYGAGQLRGAVGVYDEAGRLVR